MSEPSDKEILWRHCALNADLYKFYVDIVLKFNVVYYGITGGIVSYCLSNQRVPLVRWALVLPLLISVFFCGGCLNASFVAKRLDIDTSRVSNELGLGTSHEFSPLVLLLRLSAVLLALCALGIGFLIWLFPN